MFCAVSGLDEDESHLTVFTAGIYIEMAKEAEIMSQYCSGLNDNTLKMQNDASKQKGALAPQGFAVKDLSKKNPERAHTVP